MKAAIKGLYAITPDLADTALLIRKAEAALAGGARIFQYRNKRAAETTRREQAAALRAACRRHHAILIVNDDVELAREIDADGVHVGADDCAVAVARIRLGTAKIIGASCYGDLARARTACAEGADYLAFGSVFRSGTKPSAVAAPLSVLAAARSELGLPLVAIGGITLANASRVLAAGADAIAVIAALFDADDVRAAARAFCELVEATRHVA